MKNLSLFLLLCPAFFLHAQSLQTPTLSPYTEITQEVGLTEIGLTYSRPSAKGRKVFGELVPYGEIWRTGANVSTNLTVSEEVRISGNPLPAGTYAIYTIPGPQEWTIIIHKKTGMRSIAGGRVQPENDAFRFTVRPQWHPEMVETFTIQFSDLTSSSCQLRMAWEHTAVSFPIEVEVDAKIDAQLAELLKLPEEAAHRVYFRAAEYYLHQQKDLDQAQEWIDAALAKSENNYRYGLLKSKIYAAQGKRDLAISTVKTAYQWAKAAENANYMEQTSVYLTGLEKDTPESDQANPYAEDVAGLDQILTALYASISGGAGAPRDWYRFRHLFVEEARLIPSGKNQDGTVGYRIWSPEQYVQTVGPRLEATGFFEKEIHREVVEYGSLVHVFSTYESYRSEEEVQPFARGINSIQLLNDGARWWIMQVYWRAETEALPLPAEYLPEK